MLIKQKKLRLECLQKPVENPLEETSSFNWRAVAAVRGALSRLSEMEKEIVERFHFCGESCAAIGARLRLSEARVHRILKVARRKLKKTLGPFAQKHYGIPREAESCRICLSKDRLSIEKMLKTKTKEETWKKILRKLQTKYQLRTSPRSLERHLKEHPPGRMKKGAGNTV